MKKTILSLVFLSVILLMGNKIQSQNVYIPDANFKAALLANHTINTDNNNEISVAEAAAYTGDISVESKSIHDLTGIGAFSSIRLLRCSYNQITSLDLTGADSLEIVFCSNNNIQIINVSNNLVLENLDCPFNFLTSLDVSANSNLKYLWCGGNLLTNLDISANTALLNLQCENNLLTTLNVSNNLALVGLKCSNNSITSLNISANNALFMLKCDNNLLTNLDLTANTALNFLDCSFNHLTSLNIFADTALSTLNCIKNQITNLNVSNNKALTVLSCGANAISNLDVSQNLALEELYCTQNQLTSLNVSNNTALTSLTCDNNALTSLDVSHNPNLMDLSCNYNQLTNLDVSHNPLLSTFLCFYNQISNLDVTNNPSLTYFMCFRNQLDSLNVSGLTNLFLFYCTYNQIKSLDLSADTSLVWLGCDSNLLTSLDISANTTLGYFSCSMNHFTSIDVSNNPLLWLLDCSYNQLTSLDISSCPLLDYLYCDNNQITNIILPTNTAPFIPNKSSTVHFADSLLKQITNRHSMHFENNFNYTITDTALGVKSPKTSASLSEFTCINNELTSLDLSEFPEITSVNCLQNNLNSLNIKNGHNESVSGFNTTFNPNLTCIQVDNASAAHNGWIVDKGVYFSEDCSGPAPCIINLPDANLKAALLANSAINTNGDGEIECSEATAFAGIMEVSNAGITDMTGLSEFTSLSGLNCQGNQITNLDVSANTMLAYLNCSNCSQLSVLNVKNGNNINFTGFDATSNTILSCITVDNVAWSYTHWTGGVDAGTLFQLDCGNCIPTFSEIIENACGTFTLNSQVYTESGTYSQTLLNNAGCDSTISLYLTINPLPVVNIVADGPTSIYQGESVGLNAFGGTNSLSFDGVDDYIDCGGNSFFNLYPLTLSCWVKTTQVVPNSKAIINKYVSSSLNGYNFYVKNGIIYAWYFGNSYNYIWDGAGGVNGGNGISGGYIADGNWHYVSFTVSADGGKIYCDGVLKESLSWTGTPLPTTSGEPLRFGNYAFYPGSDFQGTVDEVSIWNTALDQTTIQQWMHQGVSSTHPDYSNLSGYWKFNETTGPVAADASGNNHNGALINDPSHMIPSDAPFSDFASYLWSTSETTQAISVSDSGHYYVTVTSADGCSAVSQPMVITKINYKTMQIKAFLESLYAGNSTMNQAQSTSGPQYAAGVADQVDVELHNNSTPYGIFYEQSNVDLHTDGTLQLNNLPANTTGSYYLAIKHRNSIETWSAQPIDFSGPGPFSYDFSTAASQAYGNNQKAVSGGYYAIYAGDASQDGIVDGSDMALTYNASLALLQGYTPEDINGDGLVDGSDIALTFNNNIGLVGKIVP